jgi:hypothetical protein
MLREWKEYRSLCDSDTLILLIEEMCMYVCDWIWCRSQWPHRLRRESRTSCLLGLRVRIPPEAWYLSVVIVVCCQVQVSALGWSLVHRSPTDCGVSNWMWSWSLDNEEDLAHWGLLRRGGGEWGESELGTFLGEGENSRPIRFHIDIKTSLSILNFISLNFPERKAKCWTIQLIHVTVHMPCLVVWRILRNLSYGGNCGSLRDVNLMVVTAWSHSLCIKYLAFPSRNICEIGAGDP